MSERTVESKVAITKAITIDGKLRADLVRAIMDKWNRERPTQTSSMAVQASEAVIAMLLVR